MKVEVLSLALRSSLDLTPFITFGTSLASPSTLRLRYTCSSPYTGYLSLSFRIFFLLPPLSSPLASLLPPWWPPQHLQWLLSPHILHSVAREVRGPPIASHQVSANTNKRQMACKYCHSPCMSSWPGTVGGGRWHKISDLCPTYLTQHTKIMPVRNKSFVNALFFFF